MLQKLKKIKLLIMDVDGVLTDTRIFLDANGEWKRFFSIRDGVGIKELQERGYKTAIITGSKANDIKERAKVLKINYFYDGFLDKEPAFQQLLTDSGFRPEEMAYIGDDIYDIPILDKVGFAVTVPESVDEVKPHTCYVTSRAGGMGAVRELCDLIIKNGFYTKKVHD